MGTVLRFGSDRIAAPDNYCMLELGKARDGTPERAPRPAGGISTEDQKEKLAAGASTVLDRDSGREVLDFT